MNKVQFKKYILILLLVTSTTLSASTMYMLTKIPKAYIVVEIFSKSVSQDIKDEITETIQDAAQELKIDTSGYSHRTLGVIVYDSYVGDNILINVEMLLGEEVKRLDDSEEVFALTYQKRKLLATKEKSEDEIYEEIIDAVDTLTYEFKEQYIEDNAQ